MSKLIHHARKQCRVPARNPSFVFIKSVYDGRWWKKSITTDHPAKLVGHYDYLPAYVKKQVSPLERPLQL